MKESIFKAYDVRGIYPSELDEESAYLIGRAFATIYKDKNVVVGGDARISTPHLKKKLINGLLESGAKVIDLGMTATPVIYFSCYGLGYDTGIMVTGSHLEKDHNGMKFCDSFGIPIGYDAGLFKVKEIVKERSFLVKNGERIDKDLTMSYTNFIEGLFPAGFKGLKIVVDGANGSAGKLYAKILRNLGVEVIELYCNPNGRFPNHTPDPMKEEFIDDLRQEVISKSADSGFGFDGDGDRLAVVDEMGNRANTNHVFSLMVEDALRANNGGKIVYGVLCSKLVEDVTLKNGGIPIANKVGHSFIATKCAEEGALIGGEVSGHYFFRESNYSDDVMIACVKLLKIMKENTVPLSDLTRKYPVFYEESKRMPIRKGMKFLFIEKLKKKLMSQGYDLITLDGVKVKFDQGWMLFRASNTEDKISLGYESSDKNEFDKIGRIVEEIISTIPT